MKLILLGVLGVLALALAPATATANGSLKVTSFPSGATVWVDGVNTAKTTPMSVTLSEGEHTVTVSLPNSGWNPDTRTVTIVAGNNDLSVTLLPLLTAGPQGPKGDKGDKGEPGEAGAPGTPAHLALAGLMCPEGTFVVGFNFSGQMLCNGPNGIPFPAPIPLLPQRQLIEDYLLGLTGTEANTTFPLQGTVLGLGAVEATINFVGFAFCQPPDPLATPSLTPPIFGCTPSLEVAFVANTTAQATLTVKIPYTFAAVNGTWSGPFGISNTLRGYGAVTTAKLVFSVPLVDAGAGQKAFGPVTLTSFTKQADLSIDFNNSLVNDAAALFESSILQMIQNALSGLARNSMSAALAAMPPFTLP